MWFNQLTVFRIESDPIPTAAELNQKLRSGIFTPCLGLDWFSEGFSAPCTALPEELVFSTENGMAVSLKREDKLLPKSVIMEALRKQVSAIEKAEGRKVGRRERNEIKEAITDNLLPRALCKVSHTEAVIAGNLLLINTSAATRAEDFVGRLRESIGSLAVTLPKTVKAPTELMTEWLKNGYCAGRFELARESTMTGYGDNPPVLRASKQDLATEEISNLVRNNKKVRQLGLIWDGRLAFVLTDNLVFKRIRYAEGLQPKPEEETEDKEQREEALHYAEQTVMTACLTEMLQELVLLLGGYA